MNGFLDSLKKRLKSIHWVEFSVFIVIIVLLFLVDLFSKQFVYHKYIDTYRNDPYFSVTAIPYLFNVTLAFNKGAAWSVGFGMVGLFSMISLIAGILLLGAFIYYFAKMPRTIRVCLALAIAGDFGNLVDRFGCWIQKGIYKDGVVDFITFDFWKGFPTFNLADSYLVIAVFVAVIYFIVSFFKGKRISKEASQDVTMKNQDDFMQKLSKKQKDSMEPNSDKKE